MKWVLRVKKTVFIKNAAVLTVSSLLLRFAGIVFKVWLAALIGSEGIGLYQLVFSVYMLAATFATSGLSTAVTRLVAEETVLGNKKGTLKILRRAIELTLLIAIISVVVIYFGAEFIATALLGDSRAATALKILPFSLPFMGVSACFRGYFIARRRATPNALTQLAEQAVRIAAVVLLATAFADKGLGVCCAAVMAGDVISEAFVCLLLFVSVSLDRKNLNGLSGRNLPKGTVKRIMHIALPITSGRYLNTALRTVENIMVPKGLSRFPSSGENALSQFGMIKGMALPILFFPSAVLNSISTLLIPEMTVAAAKRQNLLVKNTTEKVLRLTAVIAFIFSAIFFVAGEEVGRLIYKNEEGVGFLIRVLSPIVPLMYLDSISDGILKGLDEQVFTFRTAVSDSAIRIVLILALLPRTGIMGFIGIMYFSNILTCLLNVGRLIGVTKAKFSFCDGATALISAYCLTLLFDTLSRVIGITNNLVYIIFLCVASIASYVLLLFLFGIISRDDILNAVR